MPPTSQSVLLLSSHSMKEIGKEECVGVKMFSLIEVRKKHFPNISSPQVAETAVAVKTLPELSTNQGIKALFAISNIVMPSPHPFIINLNI